MEHCGYYLAFLLLTALAKDVLSQVEPVENGQRTYGGNISVTEELFPGLHEELWGDDVIVTTNYGSLRGKSRAGFPEAGEVF